MNDAQYKKPVLVLGGNGKTGRRVAERLRSRGRDVRVASRSTVPCFDWNDRETWVEALQGVGSVYITYQPDLAVPGAVEAVGRFVELAMQAGVRRHVLLSGRGEEEAQRAEHVLRDSGAEWTIVPASTAKEPAQAGFPRTSARTSWWMACWPARSFYRQARQKSRSWMRTILRTSLSKP